MKTNLEHTESKILFAPGSLMKGIDRLYALQMLVQEVKKLSGNEARDWAGFVVWGGALVSAIENLESGDPLPYRALTDSYRAYPRDRGRSVFLSAAGLMANGTARELDFRIDLRMRVRMMRCALSLVRQRQMSGAYPRAPDMSDRAMWTDLYSGESIAYTRTDDGFILQSAPKWTGYAQSETRQDLPLVFQIPVDDAVFSDPK